MKNLDVWSALPLLMLGGVSEESVDNVIAELEHSDRIQVTQPPPEIMDLRLQTSNFLRRNKKCGPV
jgi:hypothetical protein